MFENHVSVKTETSSSSSFFTAEKIGRFANEFEFWSREFIFLFFFFRSGQIRAKGDTSGYCSVAGGTGSNEFDYGFLLIFQHDVDEMDCHYHFSGKIWRP